MALCRTPACYITQLNIAAGVHYFSTGGLTYSVVKSAAVTRKKRTSKTQETSVLGKNNELLAADRPLSKNPFNIQLLPNALQNRLFGPINKENEPHTDSIQRCYEHLKKHKLYDKFGEVKQVDIPEQLAVPPLLTSGGNHDQQVDKHAPLSENEAGNIDSHFRAAAAAINQPYCKALNRLLETVANNSFPRMPLQWQASSGWTRYNPDGSWCKVAYPDEKCLLFDVETAMQEPNQPPTLATAISDKYWYSWCSEALSNRIHEDATADAEHQGSESFTHADGLKLSNLIPLESHDADKNEPRLVIGHNVAFDRSYIREQYRIEPVSRMRFLDTMSLHIALAGFANPQRAVYMSSFKSSTTKESSAAAKKAAEKKDAPDESAGKSKKPAKDADKIDEAQRQYFARRSRQHQHHTWPTMGSLNNLADVYNLHCRRNLVNTGFSAASNLEKNYEMTKSHLNQPSSIAAVAAESSKIPAALDKQLREMFVIGSLDDIAGQYQSLCTYCAKDVLATLEVLRQLWPQFQRAFPHPVTTAGMLEMSTTFLPININNWHRYIELSDRAFAEAELHVQRILNEAATHAILKYAGKNSTLSPLDDMWLWDLDWTPATISSISSTKAGALQLPVALLDELPVDYTKGGQVTVPTWYKKLLKDSNVRTTKKSAVNGRDDSTATGDDTDFLLSLSSRMRVVPKLLKLTWDGWPLHHDSKKGWGYLQPDDSKTPHVRRKSLERVSVENFEEKAEFPLKNLLLLKKAIVESAAAEVEDAENETALEKKKATINVTGAKKAASKERQQQCLDEKLKLYDTASDADRTAIIEAVVAANPPTKFFSDHDDFDADRDFGENDASAASGTVGKPHYDVVPGCVFRRLTHSDGKFGNVGNPLAQEFLEHFQSGRLGSNATSSPQLRDAVDKIVRLSKKMSQWLMYKKRVNGQILVENDELLAEGAGDDAEEKSKWGVILPRVVPMGTVTRRAVEPTWLTALNPKPERIASELKALVQAPNNYAFVGADVDSQELWIAALYGDARFAGQHGCTALGWMTLQGTKAEGTDMHSRVAQLVGCDRDQAKVLNYARIYGAGQAYVAQMLKKFHPELTIVQARSRALKLMRSTKGEKVYKLNSFGQAIMKQAQKLKAAEDALFPGAPEKVEHKTGIHAEETKTGKKTRRKLTSAKSSAVSLTADDEKQWFTQGELQFAREAVEKSRASKKKASADKLKKPAKFTTTTATKPRSSTRTFTDMISDWAWRGGSESSMFNALEAIAKSDEPRTPVLQGAVTRCLQKRHVGDDFFTSRVNWVVQSSAVDYLHLMLVSMRHLCDAAGISSARLALSIHDEVRFLVREEDKYKAALALQYTNLLTRAMFAHRVGIQSLPASVAFFSSVEIDRCMRKQANDNCITPSNVRGMFVEYGIPPGESLTIQELMEKLEKAGEGTCLINDHVNNVRQVEHVLDEKEEEQDVPLKKHDKLRAA